MSTTSTVAAKSPASLSTDELREQALKELRPFDREADETRAVPPAARQALATLLQALRSAAAADDASALLSAVEAVAFGSPTLAHAVLPKVQAALLVSRCADDAQRARLEESLASVDELTAVLLTESSGRGPGEWSTTAAPHAAQWRVNGRKIAVHGGTAGPALLAAVGEDGDIRIFAIPADNAGLTYVGEADEPTLALGASRLRAVDIADLAVGESDRLGAADSHPVVARRAVALSRLLLGALAVGTAAASLSYAEDWAVKRYAFGRPLAAFEGVAFDIADHDTRLSMARLMLPKAADAVTHATDNDEIDTVVARTLARVTSICAAAATDGVQLMGVHGIIHEHPQELFHRTASSLAVLDIDPLQSGFRL
jgi:alkylation response protein AidB-like acyl-CoA dehydrogenase